VDFAAALPQDFKVRGFRQKLILKKLMRGKLPQSVLDRKKNGFDIPTHDWFRGPLRRLLLDTLNEDTVEATGIFDWRAVESLIRDHMERRSNVGYHLWGLLTLFLWMKRWKVEVPPPAQAAGRTPAPVLAIG
jgi:asparagine synthase (glutamine-hydrolysing)